MHIYFQDDTSDFSGSGPVTSVAMACFLRVTSSAGGLNAVDSSNLVSQAARKSSVRGDFISARKAIIDNAVYGLEWTLVNVTDIAAIQVTLMSG